MGTTSCGELSATRRRRASRWPRTLGNVAHWTRSCGGVPVRRGVKVIAAHGNAKFRPAYRGTRVPAPSNLAYQRVRLWASEVVPVDEYRTTMMSFYGHKKLEDVKITNRRGSRVTSRGLKRCTHQRTLGLLHAHKLPRGWIEDASRPMTTLVSRDGNAALNMREIIARGGIRRPWWLRRPVY